MHNKLRILESNDQEKSPDQDPISWGKTGPGPGLKNSRIQLDPDPLLTQLHEHGVGTAGAGFTQPSVV